MADVAKNMDSVFSQAMQDEEEFDVLFDQEDSLIDTVNGVNESGDPLTGVDFVELHQDHHDDVSVKDIQDGEAKDNPMGAKDPEGTEIEDFDDTFVRGEVGKKSDADKFVDGADDDHQEGKDNGTAPKGNMDDLNDQIEKVAESSDDDPESLLDDEDDTLEEGGEVCPKCGANPCECGEAGCKDESCQKESCNKECNVEALEDEIEKEKDAPMEEAATGDIDSDVSKIDDADNDGEDDVIGEAEKGEKKKENMADKYSYDISDEDLINMAMND